ncbi:poly(3-hydroxyalkanoate) depolymerase [Rhodococcus sp. WB1]|uniref:alpha/beta fold hydrolase n=1 Tax=Rhodococcus TaxID=1827 RepID=UPI00081A7631|nr:MULTISPECIES: alpha/beta fold hydrolase [Rhodococcus]ANZ23374.1 poly(3-hydroxyalkanoate) depolymerase [Rhodococcus sp. WB1]MDV6295872.1 alpha/beta fold hydrolase [Rhodococcus aetherivorans]PND50645.1 poly(3-hydroxyalkanoate) depolymerase [Rhodococcus sp. ENV425]USC14884.1 alpha/beta fold hydrolase [Rhodococcus sp. 11-3]WFS11304.1 alpha/beta fold hydrolase [Rhodococcus aetherivorans]
MTAGNVLDHHTRFEERIVRVGCHRIRVSVRHGSGVPVVLCNGLGAGLEILGPIVESWNAGATIVRFDVPGAGGSPSSLVPYGFPYLAWVVGRVLDALGFRVVDVVGYSWGGALAQQFALQNPRRCRRLVLVATSTGAVSVPGSPRTLAKMLTRRRFDDAAWAAANVAELYGGTARPNAGAVAGLLGRQPRTTSRTGYLQQLLAGALWTSLPLLPLIRQPVLVVAGTDDPIVPAVNARIMHRLLPHATLHMHSGGHIDVLTGAGEVVPVIDAFLATG